MSKKLRHDRYTVSLLTDHLVFSPKYRGKVLVGDVDMVAEAIMRKTCKELDIEVNDMAVNPDHVHIFIKYPPKYSVSYISKMIKGRSSRVLRKEFPHLKEWCGDHLWAPSCYHGSVGNGWNVVEKYISPIAEATGDMRSFGFRKFRSTHDACQQVFNCLCRENSITAARFKGL